MGALELFLNSFLNYCCTQKHFLPQMMFVKTRVYETFYKYLKNDEWSDNIKCSESVIRILFILLETFQLLITA